MTEAEKAAEMPQIKWIKNDPGKHKWFSDGSRFLVALRVGKNGGPYHWEYAVVITDCDGEGMQLRSGCDDGCYYSDWTWLDFEYFALLEGSIPTDWIDENDC